MTTTGPPPRPYETAQGRPPADLWWKDDPATCGLSEREMTRRPPERHTTGGWGR